MRSIVLFAALPIAISTVGCGSTVPVEEPASEEDLVLLHAIRPGTAPRSWDSAVSRPSSEAVAEQQRKACAFRRGAMPAATLGSELPVGNGRLGDTSIPIQNVIVLMQENRSFDSYFGHLAAWAKKNKKDAQGKPLSLDIDAPTEPLHVPEKISEPTGAKAQWLHAPELCFSDTNHEWAGSHLEWNGGKMDGFFEANDGFVEEGQPAVSTPYLSGQRAMSYYDERDIPFYYDLASTFAIGDRYFSSVIGPTWPNRDFMYAASSYGVTTNKNPYCNKPGVGSSITCQQPEFFDRDTVIFDELTRRSIPWKIFVDGALPAPRLGALLSPRQLGGRWGLSSISHISTVNKLVDILEGYSGEALPSVSFIDANVLENAAGNDEHPPSDIQSGQDFVARITAALMRSPYWENTALFITYDEHGGIYDHVAPPPACTPDPSNPYPDLETDEDQEFAAEHPDLNTGFDRYGVRVPVIVVSPYAKRSFVSHKVYDHTSILRFIETKYGLPALTNRDANADPMLDMFDFNANGGRGPWASPPGLADPPFNGSWIDPNRLATCKSLYPINGNKF